MVEVQVDTNDELKRLTRLLERFIAGPDRSVKFANEIEGAFATAFGDDDERFSDLISVLAQYEPEGGDFLYDEHALIPVCRRALDELRRL